MRTYQLFDDDHPLAGTPYVEPRELVPPPSPMSEEVRTLLALIREELRNRDVDLVARIDKLLEDA